MERRRKPEGANDSNRLLEGVSVEFTELTARNPAWLVFVGPLLTSIVVAFAIRGVAESRSLLAWLVAALVVSSFNYFAHASAALRSRVNSRGVSYSAVMAGFATGLLFGSVLWIMPAVGHDPLTRRSVVAILFALSAGAVGGTASRGGVAKHVLIPLWLLAAPALLRFEDWAFALGSLAFLVLMVKDLRETHDLVLEVLHLKHLSRAQAEEASHNSIHDPLTGLLNRAGLEAATQVLQDHNGPDKPKTITTMFVDLDHFKVVNDRFGHAAGDQVLIEVASRLVEVVRDFDTVARLGGDEFFLIIGEECGNERREHLGKSIISTIERPFRIGNAEARISASIGISVVPFDSFDLATVQGQTDHAMYLAKHSGRRRAKQFNESIRSELNQRSLLETSLREAMEEGKMTAWGQEIVDTTTGKTLIIELLARWERSDGDFCPPGEFIPIAEEIGLIEDLGRQMLDQAGELLSTMRVDGPPLPVSINISPRQLVDDGFIPMVESAIDRWGIGPGELVLELTEMAGHHERSDIKQRLNKLVEIGTLISLDDFGSGYSSFQQLLGLPIEFVKLDGELVDNLGGDQRQADLISSVRDIAETLGRTVIVEGVETKQQAERLADLGLHLVQGYYIGHPRPLDRLLSTIQTRTAPTT